MQSNIIDCQVAQRTRKDGKKIVVLGTPGLMDTKLDPGRIIEDLFCAFFGEDIYKYVIVVFKHKASMRKSTIDDCLSALPAEFVTKLLKYGGNKIAIEKRIIDKNDGGYYSDKKFKEAEKAFRKRIPNIQQESLEDEYQEKAKRFEEVQIILEKKLQEEKDKLMQEKAIKKTKEDFYRKMEKINNKIIRDLRDNIIQKRSKAREEVPKSETFGEMAMKIVKEGAGLAICIVTGNIEKALETIEGLIFRK
ncbi:hypothetical protein ACJMK2_007249 [Sinanodonta woodiana]|uniref:AIG1-type G domain-containing protein n=1 Tax=Sinanodonta woodiana TaxID=1069815 RepID=A0ABD3VHZ7_SINWO